MNNIKKLLIGAALLSGASTANAQLNCNGTNRCQGPASELMTSIFPRPEGGILINSAQVVNALSCTGASGGNNILLEDTHGNYRETYAALLTASVSGNDVQLQMQSATGPCTLAFARFIN